MASHLPSWSNYLKLVGKNIKAARLQQGLRQIDVEEKIGLEYRHYQRIEAGKINLTLESLYRLSRLFRIEVEELVKKTSSSREDHSET